LNFDEYQLSAWGTALPSARTTQYLVPGIGGEVGELQSLFAKSLRDGKDLDTAAMTKELGDILWFVATLAFFYGIPLSRIAEMNIEKLESRKQRGVIGGSGDNR
jgi:NTP pyrophosphatase (non-canonical NTP hydrolase)